MGGLGARSARLSLSRRRSDARCRNHSVPLGFGAQSSYWAHRPLRSGRAHRLCRAIDIDYLGQRPDLRRAVSEPLRMRRERRI